MMKVSTVRVNISKTRARASAVRLGRAAVNRAADTTAQRARANLIAAGRIDTGGLLKSIQVNPTVSETGFSISAGKGLPDARAIFQEKGTKAHGPVSAKFLVFRPKGSGAMVFAKHVRGVTAAHYMKKAREALTPNDFGR